MKKMLLRICNWSKAISNSVIAIVVIIFVLAKINIIDIKSLGCKRNIMLISYVILIEFVIILDEIQKNKEEFVKTKFIDFVLTRERFWDGCVPAFVMMVLLIILYARGYYYTPIILSYIFYLVMNYKAPQITEFFKK